MKIHYLFFFIPLLLFSSCNKDEGLGGSSSVEGYVYNIVHRDDNFSFATDTIPAVKEDVYLIFGGHDDYFGDDVETDKDGLYRFDYLRKGNYMVYAYSHFADGRREAISKVINVGGGTNRVDTIFIHTGKAYGTAMIKGIVYARYYHNGNYRDEGWGNGMRAYIRHNGEDAFFDDVRVANGVFIFQKLLPGDYEIAVETEDKDTEKVDLIIKSITITETGKIYEIAETFDVEAAV